FEMTRAVPTDQRSLRRGAIGNVLAEEVLLVAERQHECVRRRCRTRRLPHAHRADLARPQRERLALAEILESVVVIGAHQRDRAAERSKTRGKRVSVVAADHEIVPGARIFSGEGRRLDVAHLRVLHASERNALPFLAWLLRWRRAARAVGLLLLLLAQL